MKNSEFDYKFHVVKQGLFRLAIVITTSYANSGGMKKGEWFVVFISKKVDPIGERIVFDINTGHMADLTESFSEATIASLFPSDKDSAFEKLMFQVETALDKYLNDGKSLDTGHSVSAGELQITELDTGDFFQMCLRYNLYEELNKVRLMTECDEMAAILWVAMKTRPFRVERLQAE